MISRSSRKDRPASKNTCLAILVPCCCYYLSSHLNQNSVICAHDTILGRPIQEARPKVKKVRLGLCATCVSDSAQPVFHQHQRKPNCSEVQRKVTPSTSREIPFCVGLFSPLSSENRLSWRQETWSTCCSISATAWLRPISVLLTLALGIRNQSPERESKPRLARGFRSLAGRFPTLPIARAIYSIPLAARTRHHKDLESQPRLRPESTRRTSFNV